MNTIAADIILVMSALALVVCAGLFALVNAAMSQLSPSKVQIMDKDNVPGAASLHAIVQEAPRHQATVYFLHVVCAVTASVMAGIVIGHYVSSAWSALAGSLLMVVLVFMSTAAMATNGRRDCYTIGLKTAPLVRWLGWVVGPLAQLFVNLSYTIAAKKAFPAGPFATEMALRERVDVAEQRGLLDPRDGSESADSEIDGSVFQLADTIVREVMVPRTDVLWIEEDKTVQQALRLALRSGFSRLPVVGTGIDDIVGVVYVKDLIASEQSRCDAPQITLVEQVMRPAEFVPESKRIAQLLREMQVRRIHIAVVIDEYGGTAGLVTIEDIVEEIVGEIADEYDNERPAVQHLSDGTTRVDARLPVEDLAELYDVEIDHEDVESVGGLLAQVLGKVPISGSCATVAGLVLVAEGVSGRRNRIDSVLVKRAEYPPVTDHHLATAGDNSHES